MGKKIQTALTSFGMSGLVFHSPMLKMSPNFEVVKILERTRNDSSKMFPEATIVRNYHEILNDPGIELVFVNTPDQFHYPMAKSAIEAGKHVVVEKPFTQTADDARELVALAKAKDVLLTVYQNRRWDSDFLTIKKVLEQKMVGRLVEFESHYDRYRNIIQDSWKEHDNRYGGVLYNLGSHMIDQALALFGRPLSVTAHLAALRDNSKVNDYYSIRFQYDGFAALLKSSLLVCELGPRYILNGTQGTFMKWGIDPQEEDLKSGIFPQGDEWGREPESDWGYLTSSLNGENVKQRIETQPGDYRKFYENLYLAIRHGEELAVKPEEALMVVEMLNTCLESHRQGRTIFLG